MKNCILLIDDDPLVLKSFEKLLLTNGFEVIPTSTYEDAIKAIKSKNFELILSDIRLPGKNGVEIVSKIQERLIKAGKKDLPIIFITGYAEMGVKLNANFYGEVLNKPVDNDFLLTTIREYL